MRAAFLILLEMAEAAIPIPDDKALVQLHTRVKLQCDYGLFLDQCPGCIAKSVKPLNLFFAQQLQPLIKHGRGKPWLQLDTLQNRQCPGDGFVLGSIHMSLFKRPAPDRC